MTPNWTVLLGQDQAAWRQARAAAAQAEPFVLLCTSIGSHGPVVTHDSLLAAALIARGVRVEVLLCDGALPACEVCTWYNLKPEEFLRTGPQPRLCEPCFGYGSSMFAQLGIPVHRYSQFAEPNDWELAHSTVAELRDDELAGFVLDDIALGEEAYAGTLRYFAVGDLANEPAGASAMRRYLDGAIVALRVTQRAFAQLQPQVTVFHHGIYVPQGVIGRVARQQGIRVVNWAVGYRKQTFVYSHNDTYHRTMIDEPLADWQERTLRPHEHEQLLHYLDSRKNSSQDWIKFNQEPEENTRLIRQRVGLDERPMILLLTNVTWDAQLYYKNNGFPSLIDWLEYTITYFGGREDVQLVIRVHPSEVRGTMATRQPVMQEIGRRMPVLPPNVYVVEAASDISTYTLAEMADSAIIYGTKTGVELTARGIPVIVAGEAWIRNKGLTIDVSTVDEYRQRLDQLPLRQRMPVEQVERALQYAYHYFFRRLVPIKALVPHMPSQAFVHKLGRKLKQSLKPADSPAFVQSPYTAELGSLQELHPRHDVGLDLVCDGIIHGSPFIYDPAVEREASCL